MKYRDRYDFQKTPDEYTAGQVIKRYIDRSPDYHDGELESLRRKINVISELLGAIVEVLPDHSAQLIITKVTTCEPISEAQQ